ncbi:MAG: hypothetical protein PHN91_03340 [Patescibacteria group bacterium]|jgi:hypothetical protein|nr:hypothetical protein [Patescibacteria group bacterium]MDD4466805.1 hypothetical protein [Patescibacteria group bacterium]
MAIILDTLPLIGLLLIAAGGYIGLILVISEVRRYVPEWRVISTARKKNLPVLAVTVPGSGETDWILGQKDERGDPVFDTKGQFGIQVDPNFSGAIVPDRMKKGLKVYHYATTLPLALDARHCLAIDTVVSTVRTEFPELGFLTNDQIGALLATPRDDLGEYCKSIYQMAATDEIRKTISSSDALTDLIIEAQDLSSRTEIPASGMYSYAYAFKNVPTAYLSQDLHQYGMLIERKVRKQMEDMMKKYGMLLTAGIVIIGIIIAGAVATTIIG